MIKFFGLYYCLEINISTLGNVFYLYCCLWKKWIQMNTDIILIILKLNLLIEININVSLLIIIIIINWTPLCKAGRVWEHSISVKTLYQCENTLSVWEHSISVRTLTRAGTYGKGNEPLKGCIGLLLILNSMNNSATDRRWARLQSKTPPARKPALLTIPSRSLRCESAAQHHSAEQYSKTRQDKAPKRSQKERPIIKYLLWLSHDTRPLSCSTGKRANVLLKGHLSIKRYLQYNKVSRLLQHSSM